MAKSARGDLAYAPDLAAQRIQLQEEMKTCKDCELYVKAALKAGKPQGKSVSVHIAFHGKKEQ